MRVTTIKKKRIVGFDIARGIAILLAMLSHTFTALNYSPAMEVNLLVRSSTPTFIVVFGFFLYLLYYPKIVKNDFYYVKTKLWGRSLQCYLLYFFTCSIWAYVNDFSFIYFIRLTLFLSSTPFTDILRFYAILFFYITLLTNAAKFTISSFSNPNNNDSSHTNLFYSFTVFRLYTVWSVYFNTIVWRWQCNSWPINFTFINFCFFRCLYSENVSWK